MTDHPISADEYSTIAANVPVVSVDLLVHHNGGLLLGKRTNKPAKGEYFVPGGTVLKGEGRREAVHRVATAELGCDVLIDDELGVYDHRYDSAASDGVDSKHYLATAYIVTPTAETFMEDDQHEEFRTFTAPFPSLHRYVARYVRDLRRNGYQYRQD
jgi:colanic acid biosynthesis protein WcaH